MVVAAAKKARLPRSAERTKAQFLDAAEKVFGAHGYEGTTIRAIARAARVNLGTFQHYWGSKRQLFRDLFQLRFEPVNRETLRRLKLIEQGAGKRPHAAEVLRAIIEPTFLLGGDAQWRTHVEGGNLKQFHRLYGRALLDPSPVVVAEVIRVFHQSVELSLRLLRSALPQLSAAELDWRVNCVVGAQAFSMVYSERVGAFFGPEADADPSQVVEWIMHFLLNGIDAGPLQSDSRPSALLESDVEVRSAGRGARAGSLPR
jgi:AcrR family transcriptional regulator